MQHTFIDLGIVRDVYEARFEATHERITTIAIDTIWHVRCFTLVIVFRFVRFKTITLLASAKGMQGQIKKV